MFQFRKVESTLASEKMHAYLIIYCVLGLTFIPNLLLSAYVSVLEIFCESSCFDFGNFRFKLPTERMFKEGEDGTGIFVIKTIRFVTIRCHKCGYTTLIPTYGEFRFTGPVHCADCGKLILVKNH
jgi:predicted nucleic-acid-binding Zn-ribbon protein